MDPQATIREWLDAEPDSTEAHEASYAYTEWLAKRGFPGEVRIFVGGGEFLARVLRLAGRADAIQVRTYAVPSDRKSTRWVPRAGVQSVPDKSTATA